MKNHRQGKVILVGAGPGDPDLITVKGLEALRFADVLVHDYLASPEIVAESTAAEKIYVGKTGAAHTMEQDKINELLVEKALEGKTVVRLKGGDPYLFGRGGEEALYCARHGVDIEVVPGIPAAIGAAAYAGVPLTDRRFTSSVMLITGHEDAGKETSSLDWKAVADSRATLVFYMGVKNLSGIAGRLMENGMPGGTPVAIVEWATTARQRTIRATLETAAGIAEENKVKAPALTIVGGVVALNDSLNWFERLPLFGRTVAVTRSRAQAGALARELRALGAAVIETPTIAVEPPESTAPLDEAISRLSEYQWLVFMSVNAVDSFMERLRSAGKDVRALAGIRVAAIGPATRERLKSAGVTADFSPDKFVAESVAEGLLSEYEMKGKRILVPRSSTGRRELARILGGAGARVDEVTAYRTVRPPTDVSSLADAVAAGQLDYITFTSSSTARNFVELMGEDFIRENKSRFKAASIGPITSAALREFGIEPALEAEQYTIPGLVSAILEAERKAGKKTEK